MSKQLEELREMAKLTVLSNRLNDLQIKNLTNFPFVFFDSVTEVALDYNLSNTMDVSTEEDTKDLNIKYEISTDPKLQHITYKLKVSNMQFNVQLDKRLQALEQSVRSIFWNDLKVRIFINNNLEFESKQ